MLADGERDRGAGVVESLGDRFTEGPSASSTVAWGRLPRIAVGGFEDGNQPVAGGTGSGPGAPAGFIDGAGERLHRIQGCGQLDHALVAQASPTDPGVHLG